MDGILSSQTAGNATDINNLSTSFGTYTNDANTYITNSINVVAATLQVDFVEAITNASVPLEFSEVALESIGYSSTGIEGVISSSNGVTHIGENSLVTVETNGVQQLYATDATGNAIDIDITNGSALLIDGVNVADTLAIIR